MGEERQREGETAERERQREGETERGRDTETERLKEGELLRLQRRKHEPSPSRAGRKVCHPHLQLPGVGV